MEKLVCPICGKEYEERPALSRKDNQTLICPDCGMREALEVLNIAKEEQEEIIETVNAYTK